MHLLSSLAEIVIDRTRVARKREKMNSLLIESRIDVLKHCGRPDRPRIPVLIDTDTGVNIDIFTRACAYCDSWLRDKLFAQISKLTLESQAYGAGTMMRAKLVVANINPGG